MAAPCSSSWPQLLASAPAQLQRREDLQRRNRRAQNEHRYRLRRARFREHTLLSVLPSQRLLLIDDTCTCQPLVFDSDFCFYDSTPSGYPAIRNALVHASSVCLNRSITVTGGGDAALPRSAKQARPGMLRSRIVIEVAARRRGRRHQGSRRRRRVQGRLRRWQPVCNRRDRDLRPEKPPARRRGVLRRGTTARPDLRSS